MTCISKPRFRISDVSQLFNAFFVDFLNLLPQVTKFVGRGPLMTPLSPIYEGLQVISFHLKNMVSTAEYFNLKN